MEVGRRQFLKKFIFVKKYENKIIVLLLQYLSFPALLFLCSFLALAIPKVLRYSLNITQQQKNFKEAAMNKKKIIIKILMESPLYFQNALKTRLEIVKRVIKEAN